MPRVSRLHQTLALLLVAVFLMALPGCQPSPPTAEPPSQTQNPSAPTSQPAPATPRPTSTPAPVITATPVDADPPATAVTDVKIGPEVGAQAPNFQLTDVSGTEIELGELRGHVVLLNFWTTW